MKRIALAIAMLFGMTAAKAADLMEIYNMAVQQDPDLQAAQATRDASLEAEPIARSALLPFVALTGDANYTDRHVNSSSTGLGDDSFSSAAAAVQLTQPLYRKDRLIQLEQAKDQVAQASVDYTTAEQDLILRVAQGYFGVLSAYDTLSFVQSDKKAIARQLDQAKQRFEVGLIAITGVHEAQARFDQARADEIAAENALDTSIEVLLRIIGERPETLAVLKRDVPFTPPDPASLDEWSDTALQNNPSIVSARYDMDIAKKNIEFQDAGDSLAVDLVASYGFNGSNAEFGSDTRDGVIGVQLNLPLYTGGGVQASTRQARHQYQAAQDRLEERRRAIRAQVRDAYRGVLASISRVDALEATQVSAQSALEATEAGFEVGTRTLVDVLNSQRDMFRAMRDLAQSRYDYILNTLALFQAAGTLAQDDLQRVNGWLEERKEQTSK
jgi:outer membrane protein